MRTTQLTGCVIAFLMAISFFIDAIPASTQLLCCIQSFILLVPLLLILQEISAATFIFLRNMYLWHRFKYESHKVYIIFTASVLLLLSLAISASFMYDGFFFECQISQKNLTSGSVHVEQTGFCYALLLYLNRVEISAEIVNYAVWTTIIYSLVLIYLLTKKPHDCFRCLNKNPSAIYSLYQYTHFY